MFFNALVFFKSIKQTKFGFFLSEQLNPKNAYEPHMDIHYKSLLFWRGPNHYGCELPPAREDWFQIPVWHLTQFYTKAKTGKPMKAVSTLQILKE